MERSTIAFRPHPHTVHHRRHNDSPCFPCPLATGMIATENDRKSGK